MTLFGHRMWVTMALIIVGGLELMTSFTGAEVPPDITGIINLKSFVDAEKKKDPMIKMYCLTGDINTTITTHNIPLNFDRIHFTGPAVNKTAEYNADGTGWPSGVACRLVGNYYNNYDVIVPFRGYNGSDIPTKLTYTLDSDQDLVINLGEAVNRPRHIFNKIGGGLHTTNITNGRLTFPHQQLEGSGLYWLGYTGSEFSLIVHKCKSGYYGTNCTKDCPDCMNGGRCHPQTGYCVCPPGLMGSLCQNRCPLNMIGKDCTVMLPYTAGVLVCVPHPLGCTCLPGYKGTWCEEECNYSHFGVDCREDCNCRGDDCDKATGFCNQGIPTPAAASGGPATTTVTPPGVPTTATPPAVSASATAPTTTVSTKKGDRGSDGLGDNG